LAVDFHLNQIIPGSCPSEIEEWGESHKNLSKQGKRMKTSRMMPLALGFLMIAGVVSAQDRGGQGMRGSPLFSAIDGNRDGIISPNELDRASEALRGLDRNQDGSVDAQEIGQPNGPSERNPDAKPGEPGRLGQPGRPGQPAKGKGPQPNDRGPNAKTGVGGKTDKLAMGPKFVDRLFQFDKDNDGKLSREELAAVGQGQPKQAKPGQGNKKPNRDPNASERRDSENRSDRMDENIRRPDRVPLKRGEGGERPRDGKGDGDAGPRRDKTDRDGDRPNNAQ
jgi:Ca2+-binding EF-hand superfamily protein